ncbi:MAG: efflux RND transporter permease subunit [Bacteroidales bacterium]|nr:efflux RND transporter permease subunit [Candidatus Cryptobacteroides faecihippi]
MLRRLIDRPVAVTMAMLAVVVLGLVSIRLMPVSLIPDVDIPYLTVQALSSECSAREMDKDILEPLRQQLVQINGLEDIVSEARDGSGSIRLSFPQGARMDYLFIEANEKIDRAMSLLPSGVARPKVMKASATDIPAFFVNVKGGDFPATCHFVREVIAKRFEQLPQVAMVDLSGLEEDEILILPDQAKLRQLGLTMEALERIIKASDVRLGSLVIRDGEYRYNVRFDSRSTSAEDIAAIWFDCGGRLMQVGDVAQVKVHPARKDGFVRSDGDPAVCMAVVKQSDARMSDLRESLSALMEQFKVDYPQLEFTVTRDQTRLLEYSISSLLKNILMAILLSCVVIVFFMRDFRSPLLVTLSIPVSLVFSMPCFRLMGMSINIISLSGLLLGVGMMTDNTVVLVDNITGRWNRDGNLRDAVVDGTREVLGPMMSSVLTTCVVFLPLVFMGGVAGSLFRDQALSVTTVLLTSYVVTVLVVPVFYHWWFKGQDSYSPSRLLSRLDPMPALLRWDDSWMRKSLSAKWFSWGLLVLCIAVSVVCFTMMPKERFPQMTQTDAILSVDWNEHLSVEANASRAESLEQAVKDCSDQVTSMVGSQQFILSHSGDQGVSEASVYVSCPTPSDLEAAKESLSDAILSRWPDALFSFRQSGNVFDLVFGGEEAALTARLRPIAGSEMSVASLRTLIASLREALPDVRIEDPSVVSNVMFVADPELMTLYGVSSAGLASVLSNALDGNHLFDIAQGSRSVPVVMGSDAGDLSEILSETLVEITDADADVRTIPVSSLMRQTFVEDLKTRVAGADGGCYPLNLDVPSRDVPGVMSAVREVVMNDGGFDVSFTGSWFSGRKLAGHMVWVLLAALALLYLILASQFESLVQPLVILSEIVIDIAASLLALMALGISINVMSMIGLIVVTGIVVNDSILKIDTINRLRKNGESLDDAVMDASSRRMKAILMTSLTTILAVLPFLARGSMGADLQYPMSVVIIVGMAVGTLVSLFVVPSLYHSIYNGRKD